ncbi:DUF2510 domain-containing protein [Nocardia sp. NPDC058640]|uniref:DUF2510 domain-containing protein n=1 Tax=Nocardia sp. NPDC058640 TaxID=3346571 RepID=UPI0036549BE7
MTAPQPPHQTPTQLPTGITNRKRNPAWAALLILAFIAWLGAREGLSPGGLTLLAIIGLFGFGIFLIFRALYPLGDPRPAPVTFITPPTSSKPPPGWYNHPEGGGTRWWDGARWTEHFQSPPASA